jgi:hypothetical protein
MQHELPILINITVALLAAFVGGVSCSPPEAVIHGGIYAGWCRYWPLYAWLHW